MPKSALPIPHALLALLVMAVWGTNFVVIHAALDHLPPFLFAALRFTFAAFPAVFFLKRPAVPWRRLAAYGLLIGSGQFALLYLALQGHISPGLASLVMQLQVFFTIGMAMAIGGERIHGFQIAAVLLAASGIVLIAAHGGGDATPLGLLLTCGAAAGWAGGNIVARRDTGVNMVAYVAWSSLFATPPLVLLSVVADEPRTIAASLALGGVATWGAVRWQSFGNSLFGYAAWGWLLARHPAATVAPMALLVPVFGMGASAILLGESLPAWKLGAALLVLSGLALNLTWPRLRGRWLAEPS